MKPKAEDNKYYTVAGDPLNNPDVVGEAIASECEGKPIYWLKAGQHSGQGKCISCFKKWQMLNQTLHDEPE